MSGSDDLDEQLDEWLRAEVQPMAPPPGAFAAISRRAHRRKAGRLVAASSAVAVAIVAAFAVPALTSSGLSPSGGPGGVAAGRSGGGHQAAHRPAAASTARPSASGSAAPAGATPAGALPPSFQPASATFVSVDDGWVLGHSTAGGCGTGTCVSIVQTTDRGHSWARAAATPAGMTTAAVSNLRYLDGTSGWAFGPELWSTHDGGAQWRQVPTGGKVVVDVEASDGMAFALFATCGAPGATATAITEYGRSCTDFTLESTPAGTDDWSDVGTATTGLSGSGAGAAHLTSPSITFSKDTGWLLGPDGAVYSGSLSGGPWSLESTTPCPGTGTPGAMTASLLYYEATNGDLLDVCGVSATGASAPPPIFSSTDDGQSWQQQATGPAPGAITSVAASTAAPDIVASHGALYVRPASTGRWQQVSGPPGGFSFVGTTSTAQGVAVPASQLNEIWMTYDGGITWQPYRIGS
jgi:hypothetical protein